MARPNTLVMKWKASVLAELLGESCRCCIAIFSCASVARWAVGRGLLEQLSTEVMIVLDDALARHTTDCLGRLAVMVTGASATTSYLYNSTNNFVESKTRLWLNNYPIHSFLLFLYIYTCVMINEGVWWYTDAAVQGGCAWHRASCRLVMKFKWIFSVL
jgi:hypothetical protein